MNDGRLPKKILNYNPKRKLDAECPALLWKDQQILPEALTGHQ